jgi:hypothetical protein
MTVPVPCTMLLLLLPLSSYQAVQISRYEYAPVTCMDLYGLEVGCSIIKPESHHLHTIIQ